MEYYQVAARWWKEQVCNLDRCNCNNMYNIAVERFEKNLAKSIKDNVDKQGFMFIASDDSSNELFEKLSKIQKINVKKIPKEITMFIRPYNVTVVTGRLGKVDIIYQCKEQV